MHAFECDESTEAEKEEFVEIYNVNQKMLDDHNFELALKKGVTNNASKETYLKSLPKGTNNLFDL